MKQIINIFIPVFLFFLCTSLTEKAEKLNLNTRIPTAGNSWIINNGHYISSDIITAKGIRNWKTKKQIIRTFFHINKTGQIALGLSIRVSSGTSKIKVTLGNQSTEIALRNTEFKDVFIGNFQIKVPGYYFVDIEGLDKSGDFYADVDDILLGDLNKSEINFVRDEFYWGRRGPSVHLNYEIPDDIENIEWFYSEILIPAGQDIMGSFFMANGFSEGYFGIQVNSPRERRVLFSIWSPYKTDSPDEIPEEYKIKLLKKGSGVISGEFGDEGSGGQSYKVFKWKTDVKYGFLVQAKPLDDNSTDYTAYFYDSEVNSWSLIAKFKRPKTNTYLKKLHSFLENFIPEQGVYERKGLYSNQWVYNSSGWHELNRVKFSADNTARKQNRLDYSGGVEKNKFYLRNCGFMNNHTPIGISFERDKTGIKPIIDFKALE